MRLPRPPLRRARIEIIPMIDTIFFLLVFFMISSLSMVQLQSKRVTLPQSRTATLRPTEKVIVTITSRGDYYVDHQPVATDADLKAVLAARLAARPDLAVVLNCDRTQTIGAFTRAYDLVKQADAGQVMIATAPTGGPGGTQ